MSLFDIIGPVMVGPSSSHTAGAVRIGYTVRRLLGEPVKSASIGLFGSFAATGKGHGTDRALVAGLLNMKEDDMHIPMSFDVAKEQGMDFSFHSCNIRGAHPNTTQLEVVGISGKRLSVEAASVGGGRMMIHKIDGLEVDFFGDYPTLVVHNVDEPGHINQVTGLLGKYGINIATMRLSRDERGGMAVMVIECDQEMPQKLLDEIACLPGIMKVTCLSLAQEGGEA